MLTKKSLPIAILVCAVLLYAVSLGLNKKPTSLPVVKLGYYHGGRTTVLYRGYINDEFEKEGVNVKLFTRNLGEKGLRLVPKNYDDIKNVAYYGKVSGGELLEELVAKKIDGVTAGTAFFIEAIKKGVPVVAVGMLGYETKEAPEHAIIFRKDVVIKKPGDIKGKTLMSPRAGSDRPIFLYEFLEGIGLDPKKDVKILLNENEDKQRSLLLEGKVDGGYYHMLTTESLVKNGHAYIYRKFDWMNPELSHALLVFHKDFVKKHPDEVKKIVRAYMKRIKYEHGLSKEERLRDPGNGRQRGLQIDREFMGMRFSQNKYPPFVSLELLREMQNLLLKWGYIDKKVDLENFVDNSFVKGVYEDIK